MNRSLLAFCVVIAACFESHDPNTQRITGNDCYTCHVATFAQPDAVKTHAAFAAPGGSPPTTCQDCHDTSGWKPALGGLHPAPFTFTYTDPTTLVVKNDTFLLASSPHANIKCLACHDLSLQATTDPPARGFNANCTQCHPNDRTISSAHQNAVRTFPGVTYTYTEYKYDDPTFCRACHPQGLAMTHTPGNPFRLPHRGARCTQCHDEPSGLGDTKGANTHCVTSECHGGGGTDRAHCSDTGHHPGCLNQGCHPDGRGHDGDVNSCPPKSST